MCFKDLSMLSVGAFGHLFGRIDVASHIRELNAVDQKVFHRKRFITADTKWLIFSFE